MGSDTTSTFGRAAEHECELSERQREILRMIEAGHTNREIADLLGISLDGAKWNVSEILGKLGLASRDEAAEYWRRRLSWVRFHAPGWLARPWVKLAGAGAAATVAVGIAVALLPGGEDNSSPIPGEPFRLEAVVTVYNRARKADGPADQRSAHQKVEKQDHVTWTHLDYAHSRWEAEPMTPSLRPGGRFGFVADGTREWYVDHDTEHASYGWIDPNAASAERTVGAFIQLGPSYQPNLQSFIDAWRRRGDAEARAEIAGRETLLGRETVIVEYGAERTYGGDGVAFLTGLKRIWVDSETMMILRHETDSGRFVAEVTSLDYGADLDAAAFRYGPPSGYLVEEVAQPPTAVQRSNQSPRFREPTVLPDGFSLREQTSEGNGNEVVYLDSHYGTDSYPSGPWIRIRQRIWPGGLPMSMRAGLSSAGASTDWWDDDGAQTLAWADGGLATVVTASGLTSDELWAVSDSTVDPLTGRSRFRLHARGCATMDP